MKHLIFILLTTFFAVSANAQEWDGLQWIGGGDVVQAQRLNKSQVLFIAQNLNDIGYGFLFNVKKNANGSYDLKGTTKPLTMPKNRKSAAYDIIKSKNLDCEGRHWVRKEVAGYDLLLCYDKIYHGNGDNLTGIYVQSSEDLSEFLQYVLAQVIEGKYTDASGKKYQFSTDGTCTFAGQKSTYKFQNRWGTPYFVVGINGKNYYLLLTVDGMQVYSVQKDNNGELEKGKLLNTLTADKTAPRWAFTSRYFCSDWVLGLVPPEVLRLMRNEIYARHGWVFKDATLNAYFKKCSWYKPQVSNDGIKLNDIELLNKSLIGFYENIDREDEF